MRDVEFRFGFLLVFLFRFLLRLFCHCLRLLCLLYGQRRHGRRAGLRLVVLVLVVRIGDASRRQELFEFLGRQCLALQKRLRDALALQRLPG